jgi:hypothetical protein
MNQDLSKWARSLWPLVFLSVLTHCGEKAEDTGNGPTEEKPQAVATTKAGNSIGVVDFQAFPQGLIPGKGAVKEFSSLTEEQRASLEKLTAEFWKSSDSDRRLEILDEINSSLYGTETLGLLEKVIALNDGILSARAVEMLSGNIDPSIIPLLEKALQDSAEETRSLAAAAASQVRDDSLVGFFEKVIADPSANVQIQGLDSLDGQAENRRVKILSLGLRSPLPEVQLFVIDLVQLTASRQSIEILFDALDAPDPEVRDSARFSLDFMLSQEFSNGAEAKEWWKQNRNRFDDDLAPAE